jgi:phage tail-like protein
MAADRKEVFPIDTFKVTIGGPEGAGLFNTVSGVGSSIDPTGFDHVDGQGKPQIAKTPAKAHYTDVTLTRGLDKDKQLWDWHWACIDKGIEGNRKDLTIELLDTKGGTVVTWSLVQAWPTSYQAAGYDASGGSVGTEAISFAFERLERK